MSNAVSRRDFLCAATGTVSLTWGGMRILASQAPAPAAAIESPMPRTTQPFIYGSAFYRPPNPPASQRRAMLKTLAQEYKFNTIRIFSSWVYHSREPGHFNFEELEEVMGYSDEFGLRVLNGINTEYAPYWLEAAHPEPGTLTPKINPCDWRAAVATSAEAGRDCAWIGTRCARPPPSSSRRWPKLWLNILQCMPTTAGMSRTWNLPVRIIAIRR